MTADNTHSITLVTNFYNGKQKLYTQQCDYPLQKHSLNIALCPTIKDVFTSGAHYDLDISVPNVNISVAPNQNDILPKTLLDWQNVCQACKYKHLAKETQIKR